MPIIQYACGILLCFVTSLLLKHVWTRVNLRARSNGLPLPPGPRRLPVVGNLFNVPDSYKPWVGFRNLLQEYGDVVYLELLGRPMLILGSPDVMLEFLDKRSSITSDRMISPLTKLIGQGDSFAFMPYGQRWRRHRRAFWQQFHTGVVSRYLPVQQSITHDFLAKVLDQPAACKELIRYCLTASALKAVYNADIHTVEDPRLAIIEALFVGVCEVTVAVQFLLDFFPYLQYLPTWTPGIGKFLKKLAASKAPNDHLVETEYADAKARAEERGTMDHSVVSRLLQKLAEAEGKGEDPIEGEEQIAKCVAGVAVEAGTDTTFSSATGFFAAMALHPEVQQKARAELDAVVGPHRLPEFGDRESLVYINAIVKESLRWHSVLPLGVTHKSTEDAELHGYFIPSGTVIAPNVWACMHDARYYPNPDRFDPDRFIRDGKLDPDVLDPYDFIFGFGRRKCPGRHFADAALFILVASVLHVLQIGLPVGDDGRPIEVKHEQSHGFISYPENFPCVVKPRSEQAVALIRGSRTEENQASVAEED